MSYFLPPIPHARIQTSFGPSVPSCSAQPRAQNIKMYNCDLNWYSDGTDKQLACHKELKITAISSTSLFAGGLVSRPENMHTHTAECPAYSKGCEGACRIKDCMDCSICQTMNW